MTPFTHLTQATSIGALRRFDVRCIVAALAIATVACGTTSSTTATGPTPAKCQVTLTTSLNSIGASGGSGTITVATQPECAWTVTAEMNWISELTPTSGQGNGQVQFKVGENQVASARAGDIVINDNRIRLQQEAASCRFEVSPTSHAFASSGGGGEVRVRDTDGLRLDCLQRGQLDFDRFRNNRKWYREPEIRRCRKRRRSEERLTRRCRSAERREPGQWRTDTRLYLLADGERSDASGTRRPRQRHTQHGGGVRLDRRQQCTLDHADIRPQRKRHRDHQFQRSRQLGWRTERNADDRRTDLYRDSVGSATAPPPGPAPCTFAINPTSQSIGAGGGAGTPIALTAGPGCAWTAASDAPWITLTSALSGSGDATINFSVAANSGGERSSTLTIGGQTFTVNQSAAAATPCSYGINPTSQSIGAGGGTGTTALSAANGCTWSAASNTSWITLTSATSGSGNATVGFNVATNSGGARSGTLTIAGQTFTVNQAAAPPSCSYSIKPSNQSLGPAAGTGTVAVSSASGCPWTAVSNASWITITSGSSGSGTGTVGFSVAANSGGSRTGTITIAGSTFTVTQDAACAYQIDPSSQSIGANGGAGTSGPRFDYLWLRMDRHQQRAMDHRDLRCERKRKWERQFQCGSQHWKLHSNRHADDCWANVHGVAGTPLVQLQPFPRQQGL